MNKAYGLAVAAIFVAASIYPALAIEPTSDGTGEAPNMQRGTQMQQGGTEAAEPAHQQRVSGQVTKINERNGLISVSSSQGTLKLHFPSQAIRDVKKGDQITAQYAFTKAGETEGSMRAYDIPKGLGEHRMTGTVSKVDHTKGWLNVKTDATTLELRFPPHAVRDLKKGDRITVDMAFSKGAITHH